MQEYYFIYQIPFYAPSDQRYKYAYHIRPLPPPQSALSSMIRTLKSDAVSPYDPRRQNCLHYLVGPRTKALYDSTSLPNLVQELVLRSYKFDRRIARAASDSPQIGDDGTVFAVIHTGQN